MAVTGKQVYDAALVLMDEVQETGTISPENPTAYQVKALSILNTLQFELLSPFQTPTLLNSLADTLTVPNRIAIMVIPYGLAAHLLLAEGDMSVASFLNARYEELKRKIPTEITPINDVYDVLGGMV
jgi:hypothetical protein